MKRIIISMRMDVSPQKEERNALAENLVWYFQKFDMVLFPIPNSTGNLDYFIDTIKPDGFILSGGNDVFAGLYGKSYEGNSSKTRDDLESNIIKNAILEKKPVLGICRGLQMMNVFFGGSLFKISEQRENLNHVAKTHEISLTAHKVARDIFKSDKNKVVNSYHEMGLHMGDLGTHLQAMLTSPDGLVEALLHTQYKMGGMMWHPEREGNSPGLSESLIQHLFDL